MKRIYKITQVALFGAFIVGCTDLDTAPLSSTITADQKRMWLLLTLLKLKPA